MTEALLVKAHVSGYTKKDGTYVKPHDRRGDLALHVNHHEQPVIYHPQKGEDGKSVAISNPSKPSHHSTWHSPSSVATFVPSGDHPPSLNGVPLARWKDHPKTSEGWDFVDGVNDDLDEPPFRLPAGKKAASGVVIEEPDGRVWLISPTNAFGGYETSFPKGTAEPDLSLQANAIKECFEESGLQVEITGFIGDFERTTSVARFYRAKRVGGTPIAMGWETQAVHLVPKSKMHEYLNMETDHPIAQSIGAEIPVRARD